MWCSWCGAASVRRYILIEANSTDKTRQDTRQDKLRPGRSCILWTELVRLYCLSSLPFGPTVFVLRYLLSPESPKLSRFMCARPFELQNCIARTVRVDGETCSQVKWSKVNLQVLLVHVRVLCCVCADCTRFPSTGCRLNVYSRIHRPIRVTVCQALPVLRATTFPFIIDV